MATNGEQISTQQLQKRKRREEMKHRIT
eukprot:SAG25_NODE_10847_length_321_cov_0.936937_1_plen_27_part_01